MTNLSIDMFALLKVEFYLSPQALDCFFYPLNKGDIRDLEMRRQSIKLHPGGRQQKTHPLSWDMRLNVKLDDIYIYTRFPQDFPLFLLAFCYWEKKGLKHFFT